jgi:hypothetical protein
MLNSLFDFGDLAEGGGKGGNLMAFSQDDQKKYLVKEMSDGDHKMLYTLTEEYVDHLLQGKETPDSGGCMSLIARFYAHFLGT